MYRNEIEHIAKQIKRHRKLQCLSVADFAYALDIDVSNVRRIEAGRQNCTIELLYAISNVLGIHISSLANPP